MAKDIEGVKKVYFGDIKKAVALNLGLPVEDVEGVATELFNVVAEHMESKASVTTPIGVFAPIIRKGGVYFENEVPDRIKYEWRKSVKLKEVEKVWAKEASELE